MKNRTENRSRKKRETGLSSDEEVEQVVSSCESVVRKKPKKKKGKGIETQRVAY